MDGYVESMYTKESLEKLNQFTNTILESSRVVKEVLERTHQDRPAQEPVLTANSNLAPQ